MSKLPDFIDPRLPQHQKEILIKEILGLNQEKLFLGDYKVSATKKNKIIALQKKILDGYPLQYALGTAYFLDLALEVDDNVLIPRPETELLALEALEYKAKKILEVGVGSGCVSIYLAKHSQAEITALDISSQALRIAKKNAKKHQVRIKFIKSDLFDNVNEDGFDLIIANLPYGTSKQCTYSPNEPRLAIYGGSKGFEIIKKFMAEVKNYMTKNGVGLLEIDPSQNELMREIADQYDLEVTIKKDLNKRDRVVILRSRT